MVVTIVLPLTRVNRVEEMARIIKDIDTASYTKEVLIVVDNNTISADYVKRAFDGLDINIIETGNKVPHSHNVLERRHRITEVWKLIKKTLSKTEGLVLGLEDDCHILHDYFIRIELLFREKELQLAKLGKELGFVSGVQAGRWGAKMIGAWRVDEPYNPQIIQTVPYKESGIEYVHATGFYFFLCRAERVQEVEFTYGSFGPDVFFGLALSAKGYKNYIDYSIVIPHITDSGVLVPDHDTVVLEYCKDETNNIWKRREDAIQSRSTTHVQLTC